MAAKGGDQEEKSFSFVDKRRRHEEEEAPPSPQPEPGPGAGSTPDAASSHAAPPMEGQAADHYDEEDLKAPPIDFSTFVLSLASNAMYCLGGFQDPVSGKTSINLGQAKQSIDILCLLEEKTKGNLTAEEDKLMTHVLYDLRMKYVEAIRK